MQQVVWGDSLLDYGKIEWQWTFHDLEKTPNVAYENVFNEFASVQCVKGCIVTHSNMSITCKVKPQMDIIS